jgi:hypothetical protein
MNPLALQSSGWSRRRLVCTSAVIFAVQVVLILWLGQRARRLPQRPAFRTTITLVPQGVPAEQFEGRIALEEPALFALPSLNGFSGPAWLKYPPLDYQPPEYSEPFRWLALEEQSLGATFSHFLATNVISPLLIADKPLPPLQRYEPNYPNEPVPAQSRLRVEGELAARSLKAWPAIKSWPHWQLLSNTTVQAAVDGDGSTLFATLLSESGLKEADDYALMLAGQARWRPIPRSNRSAGEVAEDPLSWGRLIFQWHTLPVPATNSTARP